MEITAHFFQPPAAQRVGGLDAAILGMRAALGRCGVEVRDDEPARGAKNAVVHFHGLWQPPHARASCRARDASAPCVLSPHGMLEPWAWAHKRWKKLPYWHLFEKPHARRCAALLATAESEAARLREFLPGQRVETLPLGMTSDAGPDYAAARAALGWADDERVLLFLSRLHVKKGVDLLLHALAQTECPARTRLVVVGDGDAAYTAQVRALADSLAGKLPRIDWVGGVWSEARWPYFQGADLFCLPTHSENFGLAVLEACQVGTPALTTTTTPWGTALADGRGYICQPEIPSIAAQLRAYFATPVWSPERRATLAAWARAEYHWDQLGPRYAALYRSLLF